MTPFAQAIAALGETPESVTALLKEKRIKGYRCSAKSCPVATYLRECGFQNVVVVASAKRYEGLYGPLLETVALPLGVKQWIENFDNDKYPEFQVDDP